MDWATRLSDRQKDWFSVTAIVCVLLLRFSKTIFLAQPISKLFLVAHWDSLLYSLRSGQSFGMDSSLVQLSIPYRFLATEYWCHGLPLWNQWNGFGMPFLADPQVFVFSPFFSIFTLFPGMHTWDIILIIQLAFGAISTYFLCRELELNFVGALMAALLFAFCPWLQWQIELLGVGICFPPFVFLYFCRMAKKGSFTNIALAGMAAAFNVLSSHPEIAFTTILFATLLTFLIAVHSKDSQHSLLSVLCSVVYRIFLSGIIAFGLSAPMFIPFLEYLCNCDSYKLKTVASAGLSWQGLLANYLFPFQPSASLFFGTLSWWGVLSCLYFEKSLKRFAQPLIICLIVSLICATRPFLFEFLFRIPPLSMPYATYWLPEYCLLISIVSGLGCSYLINKCFANTLSLKSKRVQALIVSSLILALVPLIYFPWHHNNLVLQYDPTFEPSKFNWKVWLFNFSCAAIALLILISANNKPPKRKILAVLCFLLLGFFSLAAISSKSLIIRPAFQYPKNLPFNSAFNTAIGGPDRFLSVGTHLLKPNTNLIYRLPLIQALSPISPKRFLDFTKVCGGDYYPPIFSPIISPLLKIAGVGRILSEQPILDGAIISDSPENELATSSSANINTDANLTAQINYANLLSLKNIRLLYDSKTNSLFFLATVIPLSQTAEGYHLSLIIEDEHNQSVSYIEPQSIFTSLGVQEVLSSGFVPKGIKHWSASLSLMRDKDCSILHPEHIPFGKLRKNNSWLLATSNESQRFTKINNDRFRLISQHGSILEYQDKTAFNRYFFVSKINWVKNKQTALAYLKTHTSELQDVAVLESSQKGQFEQLCHHIKFNNSANKLCTDSNNLSSTAFDKSSTIRKVDNNYSTFISATDFSLMVTAKNPSLLIASDIYYPGWKVYIDDKESKIFCADYLFRAVLIPPGKHIVRFAYQPITVILGFLFFVVTFTALLILWLIKRFLLGKHSSFNKIRT